jgi:hypothetical protein
VLNLTINNNGSIKGGGKEIKKIFLKNFYQQNLGETL